MGSGASPGQEGRDIAVQIVRVLRGAGHAALLAGGCVRDELLGLTPTDYDVATDATPDRVASLFRRTALVGAHFGVVLVKADRAVRGGVDHVVEVATFRSDGAYTDKRRPDRVTFSDARADAQRRDFTVNALFLDPLAPGSPREQVVDYVGGVEDLGRRVLRAVGDPEARLAEDHLRALRGVRLAARLGFTIDPATASAITRHAGDLRGVSAERVGDEVRRMLGHASRAQAVRLLQGLGLDAPVLGGARREAAVVRLAALPPEAPIGACLAALALDRGDVTDRASVPGVLSRWRGTLCLSNEEREEARDVLLSALCLRGEFLGVPVSVQKREAVRPGFEWALRLVEAEEPELGRRARERLEHLGRTRSGLGPAPWVTGDDLIRLGMSPGPAFARILARVYDAQLEDRVDSREEAIELAKGMGSGEAA
jgi:poly(A) polymerase